MLILLFLLFVVNLCLVLFCFLFVNNALNILFSNYFALCVLYFVKVKLINKSILAFFVSITFLSLFISNIIFLLFLFNA